MAKRNGPVRRVKEFKQRRAHWRWWRWLLFFVLIVLIAAGLFWGIRLVIKARTFQFGGRIVNHVPTQEKVVALTFDDGPLPVNTQKLLDILQRTHTKATFFELGKHIAQHPELTRAVVASGNEIGNHGYSHSSMAFMTAGNVAKEIETTNALLKQNGYPAPAIFRPPYGDKLFTLPHYAAQHNITTVMFDINPDDYPAAKLSPDKILTTVLSRVQPGSIIVLHPEYKERISSLNAIEPIIVHLKKLGYTFVTVSELLQY